jgi:hypothetical protein
MRRYGINSANNAGLFEIQQKTRRIVVRKYCFAQADVLTHADNTELKNPDNSGFFTCCRCDHSFDRDN